LYDEQSGKASGIEVIDIETNDRIQYDAKIIFLNASTVATTQILLNSTSDRFPNGLGNDSGQLGRNLMDHHSRVGASGKVEDFEDKTTFGRRPNGIFIPRYRNTGTDKRSYIRGFDYQGGGGQGKGEASDESFGAAFKQSQTEFGSWYFSLSAFGETLPYENNRITLHSSKTDQYEIPLLVIDAEFRENELKMRLDMENDAVELLETIGVKNIQSYRQEKPPLGLSKHEMGTARMGNDPKTSVLNKHNQVWDCKNVFVTDGACMTSSNCVNPSLTYMALTARAVDHAVNELNKLNL
jgi:choline dehydrogenase-like flavoprotein